MDDWNKKIDEWGWEVRYGMRLMNEGRKDGRMDQMDEWMSVWIDGQMDAWMDRRTGGLMAGHIDEWMSR